MGLIGRYLLSLSFYLPPFLMPPLLLKEGKEKGVLVGSFIIHNGDSQI
jgi:hypothetical protein